MMHLTKKLTGMGLAMSTLFLATHGLREGDAIPEVASAEAIDASVLRAEREMQSARAAAPSDLVAQ